MKRGETTYASDVEVRTCSVVMRIAEATQTTRPKQNITPNVNF